jgi:uncharacterized membrane protein YfhO
MFKKNTPKSTWMYVAIALTALIIIFWKFLFLNNYLLYTDIGNDSYYQVFPYLKAINAFKLEDKLLSWSFSFGTGQLVSGVFTGDIFNWLLFFINPKYIPKGMTLMECLKLFLTGFVYFNYLKNKSFSTALSIVGGTLVMISGYMIINASWYNYFSYVGFLWVFWLFSLEKLLTGKLQWLVIAIFLTAIDQSYNLYQFGLLSIFYLLIQKQSIQNWEKIIPRLSVAYIIGVMMGAVLLTANIFSIINSPRFDSKYSYVKQLYGTPIFGTASLIEVKTTFLRFFSNNIEGIGYGFTGYNIYVEAPLFFIGSIGLLLASQHLVKKNSKINYQAIAITFVVLIILLIPFFRYSFWLFSASYFRILSFAIGLLIFESGLKIVDDIFHKDFRINNKILIINVLTIIFLFFMFYEQPNFFYIKSLFLIIIFFILIWLSAKSQSKILLYLILGLSLLDGFIEAYSAINNRPVLNAYDLKSKKGFNDYSQDAIDWIKANDKEFYRIEKDFSSGNALISSLNDAMIQGYNGTKVFTSFNHISYVKYLKNMEELKFETEHDTRWIFGGLDRFEMLDNLAVKYILSDGKFNWSQTGCTLLKTFENVKVYKNPNYVPMGSAYSNVIKESDFENLPILKKRDTMKNYLVVSDESLEEVIDISSTSPTVESIEKSDKNLSIISHDNNHFAGKIKNRDVTLLYFSIPYDKGWTIKVDGKDTKKIIANYGMTAIILKPGQHEIDVGYRLPYLTILLILSALGFVFLIIIWNKKY